MKSVGLLVFLLASISFAQTSSRAQGSAATVEKKSEVRVDGISYSSLNQSDREILDRGELSTSRYVVGGILATYPLGLGIGHAVQGRYTEKGWIFTVGELASLTVLMAGFGDCAMSSAGADSSDCSKQGGLIFVGAMSYLGFRVWEAVDAWVVPLEQNRRYRELKSRLPSSEITFEPGFMPLAGGGALGLRVTF